VGGVVGANLEEGGVQAGAGRGEVDGDLGGLARGERSWNTAQIGQRESRGILSGDGGVVDDVEAPSGFTSIVSGILQYFWHQFKLGGMRECDVRAKFA